MRLPWIGGVQNTHKGSAVSPSAHRAVLCSPVRCEGSPSLPWQQHGSNPPTARREAGMNPPASLCWLPPRWGRGVLPLGDVVPYLCGHHHPKLWCPTSAVPSSLLGTRRSRTGSAATASRCQASGCHLLGREQAGPVGNSEPTIGAGSSLGRGTELPALQRVP